MNNFSDDEVNKKLHSFKNRHYTASSMTLVVQSQETIDTLEKLVLDSFSAVPNNGLGKEIYPDFFDTFDLGQYHKLIKVQTLKDIYRLDFNWMLRPLYKEFKCKPLLYLVSMINNETVGSLADFLKTKSWAIGVYAGRPETTTTSEFRISISLTKTGFEAVDQVCRAVFSYLKMLAHEGPKEWIFNEIKEMKELSFKYRNEPEPVSNVDFLSESMQEEWSSEFFFTGAWLVHNYNPKLIQECMNALTPEKVCLVLSSNKYSKICDQTERWKKTNYSVEDIPQKWKIVQSYPEFHLPEPNIFITKDTNLKQIEPSQIIPFTERYNKNNIH